MKKVIIHARIFDFNHFIDDGFIVFENQILNVGKMSDYVDHGEEKIDAKGQWVMPTLVCGHAHIYSTFARGLSVPFNPKNFQQILDQLWWKLDRHIDNETTYFSGLVAASEFMKNGVTTIIDHHASGKQIKGSLEALKKSVCDDAGLRGIFAFEVSDRFPVDEAIAENKQFIETYHTPFTAGLFGLHASMSLSEQTLDKVGLALGKHPIHIHVAESEMDEIDCLAQYHERIVQRLDRHGLLQPKSLLVHAISIDDSEMKLIAQRKCRIAVNTASNMNNAVGLPNILAFKSHGIKVLLGNDGLSSGMAGDYLTTYYTAHLKTASPTQFTLSDLLEMIRDTYDYAGELLGVRLGRILPGYEADVMMIPYDPPTPVDETNAFGHFFFGMAHALKPKEVFVAGKKVVADYELVNRSLSTKLKKAPQIAKALWEDIKKEDQK